MTSNDDGSAEGLGIEEARRKKMDKLIELGVDPWGSRFDDRLLIGDIVAKADSIKLKTASGETLDVPALKQVERENKKQNRMETFWAIDDDSETPVQFRQWVGDNEGKEFAGPQVRAAGRVVLQRDKGKLVFIDIQDWTGQIQLFIGRDQIGDENWEILQCVDLGDLIGVDGTLKRTKTGELSIFASEIHFLTKTLDPPPAKHIGLTDAEQRQRRRYVDLAWNEGVRDRFLDRSRIVQSIRRTLDDHGFCEIEGPTLHSVAGGAAARPFETHHNTLDLDLNLRIALELHLKRLMVGGMERVFELGRVYRNEGISPRHNPEFTMLELYQAYGDYNSMMDITEQIILNAISAVGANNEVPFGDAVIDFTPPFERKTYHELFQTHTGVDPTDESAVQAYAQSLKLETSGKHIDVIKNEIFEEKVEDELIGPVFVMDYPASICPLTKRKREQPEIAERFELFIRGMELANAYTELNDPDLQEKTFSSQLEGLSEEDSMAKMDHDFIRALRNGMPPAGGLGIGIDRLVMLLTNSQSIRDIILFPLLRPE